MSTMHGAARAKLNLTLHITGQRGDGYHLLDSLVAFTDVADEVSVTLAEGLSLTVEGPFAEEAGAGENNLALRAAKRLQAETGCSQGAAIHLTKNIPVGGGLGGGSADAAMALQLLNRLWDLQWSPSQLAALGLTLGADVPMCLMGEACHVQGIGEQLTAMPLPPLQAVLVHPRVPLLTKDVYAAFRAVPHVVMLEEPNVGEEAALIAYLQKARNDLQPAAVLLAPVLDEVLAAIEATGALLARMTGSGACCFGLYGSQAEATEAALALREAHPDWWVSGARVGSTHPKFA